MKTVGVAELKAHLSQYLAAVRRGASIVVLDRKTPIARLVPAEARPGVETIPPAPGAKRFWEVPASTAPPPAVDVVALLLEDRRRR